MVVAEQVRVIDKITIEQITDDGSDYIPYAVSKEYAIVKIKNIPTEDPQRITYDTYYIDLANKKIELFSKQSGYSFEGISSINLRDNLMIYIQETRGDSSTGSLKVFDLKNKKEIYNYQTSHRGLIAKYAVSDNYLIHYCNEVRDPDKQRLTQVSICVYDLKERKNKKIIPLETSTNYGFITIYVSYPFFTYVLKKYNEGTKKPELLYNLLTEESYPVSIPLPFETITDNFIVYPSENGLNIYNLKEDFYSPLIENINYPTAQSKIEDSIYYCENCGFDSIKLYDRNQQKIIALKLEDPLKFSNKRTVFNDGLILFSVTEEIPSSLKETTKYALYIAKLHFKYKDVDLFLPENQNRVSPNINDKIEILELLTGDIKSNDSNIILKGCTSNFECEEGLCEIETGRCVECYDGVCDCQEGYKQCLNNTKCVKTKSKNPGDFYDCEFECKSGLGKNGQCINPITISFSASKKRINVGEGTDITISFDNALDNDVEADLTVTSGNGVIISSSEACQSGSRNLCKSFHKIGAKEVKQLSIRVECVDALDKIPICGKITYTAKDFRTTTEETVELNCIKKNIVQKIGLFDKLLAFLRGIFS